MVSWECGQLQFLVVLLHSARCHKDVESVIDAAFGVQLFFALALVLQLLLVYMVSSLTYHWP